MTKSQIAGVLIKEAEDLGNGMTASAVWERHVWHWLPLQYEAFRNISSPALRNVPPMVLQHACAVRINADNGLMYGDQRRASLEPYGDDDLRPVLMEDGFDSLPQSMDKDPRTNSEREFARIFNGHYMVAFVAGWQVYLANKSTTASRYEGITAFDTLVVHAMMPDGEILSYATPEGVHAMPGSKAKAVGMKKNGGTPIRDFVRREIVPDLERRVGLVGNIDSHFEYLRHHFEVGADYDEMRRIKRERAAVSDEIRFNEDPLAGIF